MSGAKKPHPFLCGRKWGASTVYLWVLPAGAHTVRIITVSSEESRYQPGDHDTYEASVKNCSDPQVGN